MAALVRQPDPQAVDSAGFDPFLASGSDQRRLLERQPDRVPRDPRREGVKRKAGLRNAARNLAAARAGLHPADGLPQDGARALCARMRRSRENGKSFRPVAEPAACDARIAAMTASSVAQASRRTASSRALLRPISGRSSAVLSPILLANAAAISWCSAYGMNALPISTGASPPCSCTHCATVLPTWRSG